MKVVRAFNQALLTDFSINKQVACFFNKIIKTKDAKKRVWVDKKKIERTNLLELETAERGGCSKGVNDYVRELKKYM